MSFLRRIWSRDDGAVPAACTALDIGTEFAKALVFEIDETGQGTVRGVGRKRQGLSHMQSGTVADIAAVVDNCAVAPPGGRGDGRLPADAGRDRHRRRARQGLHDDAHPGAQEARASRSPTPSSSSSSTASSARRSRRPSGRSPGRPACPHVDVRLVHSAIVGASIDGYGLTNPVGLPGPPRQDRRSSTRSRRWSTSARSSPWRASWTSSCSRSSRSRTPSRGCSAPEHVRQAGALFVDVGGGTTDVALVRQGGIEGTRMFALGGRAFTKSIADRLDLPFPRAESLKVDYARGLPIAERDAGRARSSRDDVAVWAAGVELVMEELAAGEMLPSRIYLCGGGSRLPEIREALAAERFWKRLPFARPPEVSIMAPDQVESISDATSLLVDQQDVTPLGPRLAGDRDPDVRGPARRGAAPGAPRDEGLGSAAVATIVYLDADDEITSAAARIRAAADTRVGARAAVRVAGRDVADQLPAARPRGDGHGKRLDIVAPDASARALAASAGLPVFGSVGEYEAALDATDDGDDEPTTRPRAPPPRRAGGRRRRRGNRGPAPPRGVAGSRSSRRRGTGRHDRDDAGRAPTRRRRPRPRPAPDDPVAARRRSSTRSSAAAARSRSSSPGARVRGRA